MVLIMINRSIDPFTQPVFAKSFWIQLPAKMAVHIIHNHKQEEKQQVKKCTGMVKTNTKKFLLLQLLPADEKHKQQKGWGWLIYDEQDEQI